VEGTSASEKERKTRAEARGKRKDIGRREERKRQEGE